MAHTGKGGGARPKRRSRLRDLPYFLYSIPPERRDRPPASVSAGCCSCCCCCCLHSLGSLIGAAVASAPGTGEDREAKRSAVAKYWLSVLPCALLLVLILISAVGGGGDATFLAVSGILILLPCAQLAASVVACIAIASSSRPDKKAMFKKVGIITLGAIIGTAAGIAIMVPMLKGM